MVDALYQFCDAQSVAGGDTVGATAVADMTGGTQGKDAFGNAINIPVAASRLFMNVMVTTVIAAGSFRVGLYTRNSDATITDADTELCSVEIPSGAAAGSMFSVGIAQNSATWLRYVGALVDVDTDNVTGNIDCWLDTNPVTTQKLPR